jgi:hypothetical protein
MRRRVLLLMVLCITVTQNPSLAQSGTNRNVKSQYGFIENKGQVLDQNHQPNTAVQYLLNTPGLNVQLRKGGFSYDSYVTNMPAGGWKPATVQNQNVVDAEFKFHRVDITLVGSNANSTVTTGEAAADYINYYTTGVENGALNVHHYNTITYKNIYNGIDLEFTAGKNGKAFEYNFIVHPGANPSVIKLQYTGANSTELLNNSINIKVAHGSMDEVIPASFIATTKEPVEVVYNSKGVNTYGYTVGAYDKSKTLIIDPTPALAYASYYGGSGTDVSFGGSVQGSNMYVCGTTLSSTNIATTGSHQSNYWNQTDGYFAKFSLAGVRAWSTYYGNAQREVIFSVVASSAGNIFVGGQTSSTSGFSSSGSVMQPGFGGNFDGFIAKFNSNGVRQWGTYLGGSSFETVYSLAVDANGDVAFGGVTASQNMYTPGAQKQFLSGPADAWVGNVEGAGATGAYFITYAGADNFDEAHGVGVDASGNVYLTGTAYQPISSQYIATTGSHQPFFGGDTTDCFLMKYDSNGDLQWGTYYGGTSGETLYSGASQKLALDASGNIYMTGSTSSTGSAIATTGSSSGGEEGFVVKFNPSGVRQWGRFIGASGDDATEGIAIDGSANIYLAGFTSSTSGLATSNAYQTSNNGIGVCMFATKLNTSGVIQWSTFFGGNAQEDGYGIAADANGAAYIFGSTTSTTGLATTGSHQPTIGGGTDAFFAKFVNCTGVNITGNATTTPSCTGQSNGSITVTANGGVSPYEYQLNSSAFQSSNIFNNLAAASYTVTVKDANGCTGIIGSYSVSSVPGVTTPSIIGPSTAESLSTQTYSTSSQTGATYQWTATGGAVLTGQGTNQVTVTWGNVGTGNLKVVVSAGAPCQDSVTVSVNITPTSVDDIYANAGLTVYPNPAKDYITIKAEQTINAEIKLFDNYGRLVHQQPMQKEQRVDISALPAGIYHLNIGGWHKTITKL